VFKDKRTHERLLARDSNVSPAPSFSFDLRFYFVFAACLLLVFPLHESAHYLTYRSMGIHLQMTLNTASPADQSQRKPIAEFAGPLFNLLLAIGCALAYCTASRGRLLWAAMGLAASMMRLVIYAIILVAAIITGSGMAMGNDEPIAASLWGLPSLTFVAALSPLFVLVVWLLLRDFRETLRMKVLNAVGLSLVTLCIGLLIGNVLDPWLFPHR
jgi:hypothetical protein